MGICFYKKDVLKSIYHLSTCGGCGLLRVLALVSPAQRGWAAGWDLQLWPRPPPDLPRPRAGFPTLGQLPSVPSAGVDFHLEEPGTPASLACPGHCPATGRTGLLRRFLSCSWWPGCRVRSFLSRYPPGSAGASRSGAGTQVQPTGTATYSCLQSGDPVCQQSLLPSSTSK